MIKYFPPDVALSSECQIQYSSHGHFDGYDIIGILNCPSNVKNDVIQAVQPGEKIDVNNEDCTQYDICIEDYTFKRVFENPAFHRSGLPQWLPSNYQGTWTIYSYQLESSEIYTHYSILYYHENSGKLYFNAGKSEKL
jgi:hypothetical protein